MKNALQRACLALPCVLLIAIPQAMAGQAGPDKSSSSQPRARLQQLQAKTRRLKADLLDRQLSTERKTNNLLVLLASRGPSQPLKTLAVSVDQGQTIRHSYTKRERQALAGGALQPLRLPVAPKGKHVLHIRISAHEGHGRTQTWHATRTFRSDGKPGALLLTLNWLSHPTGKMMPRTSLRTVP